MLASYFVGRAKFPLRYPVGRIGAYFFGALVLYALGRYIDLSNQWLTMAARTPLLIIYIMAVLKFENIPLIHKR